MTGEQFAEWQEKMDWSDIRAAAELQLHRNTVWNYRHGRQPIPTTVALACAALEKGLPPYGDAA